MSDSDGLDLASEWRLRPQFSALLAWAEFLLVGQGGHDIGEEIDPSRDGALLLGDVLKARDTSVSTSYPSYLVHSNNHFAIDRSQRL